MKGKLITAPHAAELLGVSTPTFHKMVETAEDPLLTPVETTGPKLWPLDKILRFLDRRDKEESRRRADLLKQWNAKTAEG